MAEEISTEGLGLPPGYRLTQAAWPKHVGLPDYYVLSIGARHVQWPVDDGLDYDRVLKHAVECLERVRGRDSAG